MHMNDYQQAAIKTAVYPPESKVIYPALGLANEAGEALGVIKKMMRGDPPSNSQEKLKAELGDTLWYLAVLAADAGIMLDDIATYNLAKLADRASRDTIKGSGDER